MSDETAAIQGQLDAGGTVVLPAGTHMVKSLELRAGNRLIMERGCVLKRMPGTVPGNIVLHVGFDVPDVTIEGGEVDGNRAEGPSELVHCIGLEGSVNTTIRNVTVRNAPTSPTLGQYGDGLYVGGAHALNATPTRGLLVDGLISDGNDRHGMQIACLDGARFTNCIFRNTVTSDPGSAVNFEPAYTEQVIRDVLFEGCRFETSEQGLTANNHYYGAWSNLAFERCRFSNNRNDGASLGGAGMFLGFRFSDCQFDGNQGSGFYGYQTRGLVLERCRMERNVAHGGFFDSSHVMSVRDCLFLGNGANGAFLAAQKPYLSAFERCDFFNNGTAASPAHSNGLKSQADWADANGSKLVIRNCRTGNIGASSQLWGYRMEQPGSWGTQFIDNLAAGNATAELYEGN